MTSNTLFTVPYKFGVEKWCWMSSQGVMLYIWSYRFKDILKEIILKNRTAIETTEANKTASTQKQMSPCHRSFFLVISKSYSFVVVMAFIPFRKQQY